MWCNTKAVCPRSGKGRIKLRCSRGQLLLIPTLLLVAPIDAQTAERASQNTSVVQYHLADRAPIWQIAPSPTLVLEGTPVVPFSRVTGAVRLDDGRLVVAERDTRQLHYFDEGGVYLRTVGRKGKGPGDFTDIDDFERRGDLLVIYDGTLAVHFIRAADGNHVATRRLPRLSGYTTNPAVGVFRSGTVLYRARPIRRPAPIGVVVEDSLPLFALPAAAASRRLQSFPIGQEVRASARSASYLIGFGPRGRFAVFSERICAGYTAVYEITCFNNQGRSLVIIQREVTRRPVTARERAALERNKAGFRSDGSNRYEGTLLEHRRRVAADLRFAVTHPAFFDLFAAQTGDLWVREYAPEDGASDARRVFPTKPSSWSIFAPGGQWIGSVRLAAGFVPTDIGADYVLGVTQDEDEVERVALYRLTPSR